MEKLINWITIGIVGVGAILIYQKISSSGSESQFPPPRPAKSQPAATTPAPEHPAPKETTTTVAATAPATPAPTAPTAPTPVVTTAPAAVPVTPTAPTAPTAVVATTPQPTTTPVTAQPTTPATTTVQPIPVAPAPAAQATPAAVQTAVTQPPAPATAAVTQPAKAAAAIPTPAPGPALAPAPPTYQNRTRQMPRALQDLRPQDYVPSLPPNSQAAYLTARQSAEKGDLMAMRSWRSMWTNSLREPQRTLVDMDHVKILLKNKARSRNATEEYNARKNNLMEAKTLTQGARIRTARNPELAELLSNANTEVERELTSLEEQHSGRR